MFSNSTAVFGSCGYTSSIVKVSSMHLRVLGVAPPSFLNHWAVAIQIRVNIRGGARLLLGIYCGIAALDQSTQLQSLIDRELMEERGEGVRKEPVREEEEKARGEVKEALRKNSMEEAAGTQKREK